MCDVEIIPTEHLVIQLLGVYQLIRIDEYAL